MEVLLQYKLAHMISDSNFIDREGMNDVRPTVLLT